MELILKFMSLWLVSQMFFFDSNSASLGFRPDRVIFLLIMGLYIFSVVKSETKLSLGNIEVYMIIFTVICTVSLIVSGANADVSHGKNKWLNALFNITYFPFITYFIAKSIKYNKKTIILFFTVLCFIGFYLSLMGIFEHFRIDALVWPRYILDSTKGTHWGRVRGPFLESVAMGRIMVITFLCILLMSTQYQGMKKTILYIFMLLTVVSIYFTYTRGPWLGFGLALIIIILTRNKMKLPASLLIMTILLVAALGLGSKFSLFEGTLFSQRQNTVDDRLVSYTITMKMATANPVTGIGFGKFGSEWENYFSAVKDITFGGFDGSHNTFLSILAEVGVIGFIFFLSILYNLVKMCLKLYSRIDVNMVFEKNMIVMVMAVAFMYILTGIFSDLRWNLLQNNIMYLLFGIIASLANHINMDLHKGQYS